jgi:hypothetical protein
MSSGFKPSVEQLKSGRPRSCDASYSVLLMGSIGSTVPVYQCCASAIDIKPILLPQFMMTKIK